MRTMMRKVITLQQVVTSLLAATILRAETLQVATLQQAVRTAELREPKAPEMVNNPE